MHASSRSVLNQLVFTLGAGLALFLTALGYLHLPCPGDNSCLPVLLSRFALIFQIPASAYGALFWLGILFVDDDTKRGALLALFATCATAFLALQLFILKGFCLYCVVHTLLTIAAVALRHEKPKFVTLLFSVTLAGAATAATIKWTPPERVPTAHAEVLAVRSSVRPWLGAVDASSPVLVLRLDDPGTLHFLEALTSSEWEEPVKGPAIYLRVTPRNRTLTTIFVADILAHSNRGTQAFVDAARELCVNSDIAQKDPVALARTWTNRQPAAREKRVSAAWILNDQNEQLQLYRLGDSTPLLLTVGAEPLKAFDADVLFKKKP